MKVPPLLTGAALVFWGWQVGLPWLALPIALAFEGARLAPWQWTFSEPDLRRVADLCTLSMVAAGIYFYGHGHIGTVVLGLLRWSPVLLFPLMAAQLYGDREGVEMSALFWSQRGRPGGERRLDLRPPYLLAVILAASVATTYVAWYYAGAALLLAWLLWNGRPRRGHPLVWVATLAVALVIGHTVHGGLRQLQRDFEDVVEDWLTELWLGDMDPYKATTAIGEIGTLKGSDRIVVRVWPDRRPRQPLLLRTASFNRYVNTTWYAGQLPFEAVPGGHEEASWILGKAATQATASAEIALSLRRGRGMLPLPIGTREIADLPAGELRRNPLGAVKVGEAPGLIRFRVRYDRDTILDQPPTAHDLKIPRHERPAVAQVAKTLRLQAKTGREVFATIEHHFRNRFRYALRLETGGDAETPLANFLLHNRSGHCEYFATAAVLLLRQAGIPARYATGWSVQEYSPLEGAFVARRRHAHSWVLAYWDGAWHNFDPTPPGWSGIEADAASILEPLWDLFGRAAYLFSQWRWSSDSEDWQRPLLGVLALLAVILIWRLRTRHRAVRRAQRGKTAPVHKTPRPGSDSPFFAIEQRLAAAGLPRDEGETARQWLHRVERERPDLVADRQLWRALELHYRYRFGGQSPDPAVKAQLEALLSQPAPR